MDHDQGTNFKKLDSDDGNTFGLGICNYFSFKCHLWIEGVRYTALSTNLKTNSSK